MNKKKKMIARKTWSDFRNTGLLLLVNQFLHIFGWAIVFVFDEEANIKEVYPARVKFRGFSQESTQEAYKKISLYLLDEAIELNKEANDE